MQWYRLHSRIPEHLAADFEAEWLQQCYARCQILAAITLVYPLIVVGSFFVRRPNLTNPPLAVVLLATLGVLFWVSLRTRHSLRAVQGAAEKSATLGLQRQVVDNYAFALILYTNATFAALWDLEGINSSYILGILIFGAVFFRPNPTNYAIYATSLIHYLIWILAVPHSYTIQTLSFFGGVMSTFGSWVIATMFYRYQVDSFVKHDTIQNQSHVLKRLNQQLKHLASTDGLTQIANRSHFDQVFDAQFHPDTSQPSRLGLLLCDVDYFKKFNDTYGHPAGDECLRQIARAMQAMVRREGDCLARYGGEEFVVLITQATPEIVMDIANRIAHSVRELQIPHQHSPHQVVTLSIGAFCEHPTQMATPGQFVAQADQALYRAKALGRNQVVYGSRNALSPTAGSEG